MAIDIDQKNLNYSSVNKQSKPKVLHASLEYKKRVGGVGAVTSGLTPALLKDGEYDVSVVTPFYNIYNDFYKDKTIESLGHVEHIYKGEKFKSEIFRVCTEMVNGEPLYHYLIKSEQRYPVAAIFDIDDESNIYQPLPKSQPGNRMEYFSGALAAMVRLPNDNIPEFDILHTHTWHAGLAGVIIKMMEKLPKYQEIISRLDKPYKKIPHVVSTVHMLMEREHGQLTSVQAIREFVYSLGLPENFASNFPRWGEYISPGHLKRVALALLFADEITTVSEGLKQETISGKGQGLDDLFVTYNQQGRLHGVLNGITVADFDPYSSKVLQDFVFTGDVVSSKQNIKQHVSTIYPQLDPNKPWFGFVGRLALEKGIDMLVDAQKYIEEVGGVFIVLCSHVVFDIVNGQKVSRYQNIIDELRKNPNVLVIDTIEEQKRVGKLLRAAWDITAITSHNEACGLTQIEGFQFGDFVVGPEIQGLVDSIIEIPIDPINGTGFRYNDDPSERKNSLREAINAAIKFYHSKHADGSMNEFLLNLMQQAKNHDWGNGATKKYKNVYKETLRRELRVADVILADANPQAHKDVGLVKELPKPMLHQFNNKIKSNHTKPRVFGIGPNKTGTQSLYQWFVKNNVEARQYAYKNGESYKTLASSIAANQQQGKPLIPHELNDVVGFFDMEDVYLQPPVFIWRDYYKVLDKQYPGSKFILHTRDREAWIASRLAHVDPIKNIPYVEVLSAQYNMSCDELINLWRKEWDEHHAAVKEYFKDRPNDLIIFNVETDNPLILSKFLAAIDVKLDPHLFDHHNKTPEERKNGNGNGHGNGNGNGNGLTHTKKPALAK